MDVWKPPLAWIFYTDVDGWSVASDSCRDSFCGCPCADSRIRPVESQTVGQDPGDRRGDPGIDQIPFWYSTWHLYAVGAGAGSLRARIRRVCRQKLRVAVISQQGPYKPSD